MKLQHLALIISLFTFSNAAIVTKVVMQTNVVTVVAKPTSQPPAPVAKNVVTVTVGAQDKEKDTTTVTPDKSTSEKPAESSSSSNEDDFQGYMVGEHNKKRELHNVGNLAWNNTLQTYAQNYADQHSCLFVHSGGPYGENLATGSPQSDWKSSSASTISMWYDEIKDYDYSNPGFSESTGHFTQMIWKDTTQLGCAYKVCGSTWYVICEYYPAGNIVGDTNNWKNNVPALK